MKRMLHRPDLFILTKNRLVGDSLLLKQAISRILYKAIIYLGPTLPSDSGELLFHENSKINLSASGLLLLPGKNLAPTLLRGRSPDSNVGTVSLRHITRSCVAASSLFASLASPPAGVTRYPFIRLIGGRSSDFPERNILQSKIVRPDCLTCLSKYIITTPRTPVNNQK